MHDELIRYGLSTEKLELDIFADYTRDELFNLRSGLEHGIQNKEEWGKYKVTYD